MSVTDIRMVRQGNLLMQAYQIPVTDTEGIAELCREKEIDGIITSFSDLFWNVW